MSEDELNWVHEDFEHSDAERYGDDFGDYESDDDIWDIDTWDPEMSVIEVGIDEERYLFAYDPIINHIYYPTNDPGVWEAGVWEGGTTYQIVFTKTEMLSQLVGAWQKRSKADLQAEFSDAEYSALVPNLFQLEEEDRIKLRSFSVRKFLEVMGGQEEVAKFREKIDRVLTLTRNVLSSILAGCLPMDLPYPALRNILYHLMREKGLHNVGFLSSDDEVKKKDERFILSLLEENITYFYQFMKRLMFNSYPHPFSNSTKDMRNMVTRFEKNLEELGVLAEKMGNGEKVEGKGIDSCYSSEEWESEPE